MGITREDKAGHTAAVLRNWEFFRAPLAGIVCMYKDLGPDVRIGGGGQGGLSGREGCRGRRRRKDVSRPSIGQGCPSISSRAP
jgi:hypothetical protein